jgi:hypothetical protein
VFEMAAPIQSRRMRGAFLHRFLNVKSERPAEIHKQIVVVYGNAMNRHLFLHLKQHLSGKKFDDDEAVTTWFKGQAADFYDSGIKKLLPRLKKMFGQCRRLC